MSEEVELPTCGGWNCQQKLYFLQERCPRCGTHQDWYEFLKLECPNCGRAVNSNRLSCYCGNELNPWVAVIEEALTYSAHTDLAVSKEELAHPTAWEFEQGSGKPVGQQADYRLPLPDERGIHVKEYGDRYKVHWDKVAPSQNGLGHLRSDAPIETASTAVLAYMLARVFSSG